MTEHTKTLWGIDKDPDTGELYLYGGDVIDPTNGEVSQPIIATLSNNSPVDDANAAHIVKCVNAHDELIQTLADVNALFNFHYAIGDDDEAGNAIQEKVRNLLANLKGA